jgi:hypothetical protein
MSIRYRRRATRKPREIEQSDAMRERDELRLSLALARGEIANLREDLAIRTLEADKFLNDKILLATELREARSAIEFLKGKSGWHVDRLPSEVLN